MSTDLIIPWPSNCDYPLWRSWLQEERGRFARVLIVKTLPHDGPDYSDFMSIELERSEVEILDGTKPEGDWRDWATNIALSRSDAEWVWFTEQDFFIECNFWQTIAKMMETADVIGVKQDERWHPCCLFVRRTFVEATPRYFGSEPVDHFWSFGQALADAGARFSEVHPDSYYHMAGLSRNHQLLDAGLWDEIYKPEEFAWYLCKCLSSGIKRHPAWVDQAARWLVT